VRTLALGVIVVSSVLPGLVSAQTPVAAKGIQVSLSCGRQSVAAIEAFPVKITVANDAHAPALRFARSDVVSPTSLVAASYDRKGQWVVVRDPPADGEVELRPGESFSIAARVSIPEALAKTPGGLTMQWVGRGALAGLRGNEISISIREDRNPTAALETSEGTIVLELWPDKAPNHVANFVTLARAGFYDGRIFHRVIPGFMIQTGCPLGTGTGDAGYKIPAEFTETSFTRGVLGMARNPGDDHSAGSQFFVCVADAKSLDGKYTAFGRVIEGQEIADKISQVPRDTRANDRPNADVPLRKVSVVLPASYQIPEVRKVGAPASRAETRSESR
jgi:peptidyl-prolyl cis-trans isomerase B (cyclophilin B)